MLTSVWQNLEFITLIIVASIVLLVVLLLLGSIISSAKYNKERKESIESQARTLRVYVINVKQNVVTYFDRSNISNKKRMDLFNFYSHFTPDDTPKVKNWIFEICTKPDEVDDYLEANIIIKKKSSVYFTLLHLVKYDQTTGLITVESSLFEYVNSAKRIKAKQKKHRNNIGLRSKEEAESVISNTKSVNGYTFSIRLFHIRQQALSNEKIEKAKSFTIKNNLYNLVIDKKHPRIAVDENEDELLLFDLSLKNKEEALAFIVQITNEINECLLLNGYKSSIGFSIGGVANNLFYQDFHTLVEKAKSASITAQQNGVSSFFYEKRRKADFEINRYSERMAEIIKYNYFRYLYRPIIYSSQKKAVGYFCYLKSYNAAFSSNVELSYFAAKVGKNRELFDKTTNYFINKFANERQNSNFKLFFNISLVDVDNAIELLPANPNFSSTRIVVYFDEQEIDANAGDLELITASFNKLHEIGVQIGLSLKDKNLLLDSEFYENFDYFIAGGQIISEIKHNNRIRLSIHALVESLLKYEKPIIASDLENWQAVELVTRSGIKYVSSEVISASNDMILPVDRKKLDKLYMMEDSFR